MEIVIARSEFLKALNKVLRGFKKGTATHGRLSVEESQLTAELSNRIVRVAVKSDAAGTVWLPVRLIFWLRRVVLESNANFGHLEIHPAYIRFNDLIRDGRIMFSD